MMCRTNGTGKRLPCCTEIWRSLPSFLTSEAKAFGVELTLFRAVQESLTNVQPRSGSQRARIQAHHTEDLILEISDLDPSGGMPKPASAAPFQPAIGIPSMQERIGGQLKIDFTNHRTTVRVRMPLELKCEKIKTIAVF